MSKAIERAKKAAPHVATGLITLAVQAIILASQVSESCQNEIRDFCTNILAIARHLL